MNRENSFYLLVLCVFLIFFGRSYQYVFFDAPLRVLLWDEKIMSGFVQNVLGMTWKEYASDLSITQKVQYAIKSIGVFFFICSLCSLLVIKLKNKSLRFFLITGSVVLFIHALLEMKDKFYHIAQFFEFGIQIGTPVILVLLVSKKLSVERLLLIAKILIASTFAAHGLYAVGFYPVPGHFIDMVINSLGVSERFSRIFLNIVGVLDLVLAIGLFFKPTEKTALIYAAIWGILTASARVIADFNFDFATNSFHQLLYQTLFRLPHGLLPLFVLWYKEK